MVFITDGESAEQLLKMSPEEILLRWVNYQLEKVTLSLCMQSGDKIRSLSNFLVP